VQDAVEYGGEHFRRCPFAKEIVHASKQESKLGIAGRHGGEGSLQVGRQHGGGKALARDVRHDEPVPLVGQIHHVIVVSAHVFHRHGGGANLEVVGLREAARQKPLLDVAG